MLLPHRLPEVCRLNIGEPLVAESRIALVLLPAIGSANPGSRICQDIYRKTISFSSRRIECPRSIAVVVAGETAVIFRPCRHLDCEKINSPGLCLIRLSRQSGLMRIEIEPYKPCKSYSDRDQYSLL